MRSRSSSTGGAYAGWLVFALIALATVAAMLGLVRWLAPQLLGFPVDLRLVRTSETLPAFYDGVFRASDYQPGSFLVNDPVTVIRARPGLPDGVGTGPHDLLGFRNRDVPNVADVVVIGDSQTYGNNVLLEDNWPSRLAAGLAESGNRVYAMATGGWGATQYLEMATKATAFAPQLVVVAFYTGNDPLESFQVAYAVERFHDLRPDTSLGPGDAPAVTLATPPGENWPVRFADGTETVFTPRLRLPSIERSAVADAGFAVMQSAAREIARVLAARGVGVLFTVIPTKEYAYAQRVGREGLEPPAEYSRLVAAEQTRLEALSRALSSIPGTAYVDVSAALQSAALDAPLLYPRDANGHPFSAGYQVIADAVGEAVGARVRARPRGLLAVATGAPGEAILMLSTPQGLWRFSELQRALDCGWTREQIQQTTFRAVAGLPRLGTMERVDPARCGPPR